MGKLEDDIKEEAKEIELAMNTPEEKTNKRLVFRVTESEKKEIDRVLLSSVHFPNAKLSGRIRGVISGEVKFWTKETELNDLIPKLKETGYRINDLAKFYNSEYSVNPSADSVLAFAKRSGLYDVLKEVCKSHLKSLEKHNEISDSPVKYFEAED